MSRLLVIAIGGNALLTPHEKGTVAEQRANAARTCEQLAFLFRGPDLLILTHGNGPQVGGIILQHETARKEVPALTLDACVAQSQGSMGFYLEQGILNAMQANGITRRSATVLTHVLVDGQDPAFKNPTKPIGRFYTKEKANALSDERGWIMKEDAGRGWRRVVPSPKPVKVLQAGTIHDLALKGAIVIAAGGGGIPVMTNGTGAYIGVEAVIDKDLASAELASELKADLLIILTAIPHASTRYKTPQESPIREIRARELQKLMKEGHFAEGSMKPKIFAVLSYIAKGGRQAIITDIEHLSEALAGKAGTIVKN